MTLKSKGIIFIHLTLKSKGIIFIHLTLKSKSITFIHLTLKSKSITFAFTLKEELMKRNLYKINLIQYFSILMLLFIASCTLEDKGVQSEQELSKSESQENKVVSQDEAELEEKINRIEHTHKVEIMKFKGATFKVNRQ